MTPEMPCHTTDVSFDDAIRACELIDSYFVLPGLVQPGRIPALRARVSRSAIQDVCSPLFGTPESELRRRILSILSDFRLKRGASESVKAGHKALRTTLRSFAEGR
jgi:hypothetical protein